MDRNREYRLCMGGALAAALLATGGIAFFSLPAAGIAAAGFALILGIWDAYTRWRYRQIARLSEYLRDIASGQSSLDICDNREGELSILKSEIYKLTGKLLEQSELLTKDKRYLADALSNISHQLKTPLTSMGVMTDLLQREDLPAAQRTEFTGRIRRQLERLEWLMNCLLKLSRIDAGTVEFRCEPVRVRELAEWAVEPLAIPLELRGIEVSLQGEPEATFDGDRSWSREALVNILKNALEHTPEGGRIDIAWQEDPLRTRITVRDTGDGIDPSDLPRIFERFYRGKNSGEDSVGIGLAMARSIVQSQGGRIWVDSRPGEGTTFTLQFDKRVI